MRACSQATASSSTSCCSSTASLATAPSPRRKLAAAAARTTTTPTHGLPRRTVPARRSSVTAPALPFTKLKESGTTAVPQPTAPAPPRTLPDLPPPNDPGFAAFKELVNSARTTAGEGRPNLVPLYERLLCDALTPVLAYRCLVAADDRDAPSFLFESVTGGEQTGRWSFVGARPALELVARGHSVTVIDHAKGTRETIEGSSSSSSSQSASSSSSDSPPLLDPLGAAEAMASTWRPVDPKCVRGLPAEVFTGGFVGYAGYDTVRYVYGSKLPFSSAPPDNEKLPDMHLARYDDVVAFDGASKLAYCVSWAHLDEHGGSLERAYADARARLDALAARLAAAGRTGGPRLPASRIAMETSRRPARPDATSNMTRAEFLGAVAETKEHILAGDVFQLVLSQRFERRTYADPFEVYRALRVVNPSPYMIYLQCRGAILVASSPEILCRVGADRKVTNRPLAGTRARGADPAADEALERELLADAKERAEHVMLVDLGRNDVGRVASPGTVEVEKLMEIERYSHVMHISSTVTGKLLPQLTPWDALRAALPAGTVSGAPKVRAMQIIDGLEAAKRGPYGGGIGHVSYTGLLDMALALRTMVIPTAPGDGGYWYAPSSNPTTANSYGERRDEHGKRIDRPRREWRVFLQAGAGVVADSVPEAEYEETVNKAAALGRAVDLAEETFVGVVKGQ